MTQCFSFLGSKAGFAVTLVFAGLAAYLLWTHTGHFVYALPYLFLLACPLMHLLGHRHGHSGHDRRSETPDDRSPSYIA